MNPTNMFFELMVQPEHPLRINIFQDCSEYFTPANQAAHFEEGLKPLIPLSDDVWDLHLQTRKN